MASWSPGANHRKFWGKQIFLDTDQGINTSVRKIRQALLDEPENPQFLETVVGKGYPLGSVVSDRPGGVLVVSLPDVRTARSPQPNVLSPNTQSTTNTYDPYMCRQDPDN